MLTMKSLVIAAATLQSAVVGESPPPRHGRYRYHQHLKNPRLNRSAKWPRAKSYQEARDRSPFPDRPVR